MERPHVDHPHLMLAIPLIRGAPAPVLRECDQWAIFQVDRRDNRVLYESRHRAPPPDPGLLPRQLDELGVDVVLARAVRKGAQAQFEEHGITVVQNVPSGRPSEIIRKYLNGELASSTPEAT
jgi:predicted Fe-Mo cluster-binding NifX family protein